MDLALGPTSGFVLVVCQNVILNRRLTIPEYSGGAACGHLTKFFIVGFVGLAINLPSLLFVQSS